jgi:hypothetical protein
VSKPSFTGKRLILFENHGEVSYFRCVHPGQTLIPHIRLCADEHCLGPCQSRPNKSNFQPMKVSRRAIGDFFRLRRGIREGSVSRAT